MTIRSNRFPIATPVVSVLGVGLLAGLLAAGPFASRASAQAQTPAPATTEKALPPISLDLRDAPIRQALEQLFSSAGVQFSIDNNVAGFVTLQDRRSAVRERAQGSAALVEPGAGVHPRGRRLLHQAPPPRYATSIDSKQSRTARSYGRTRTDAKKFPSLEELQLTYADPADLQGILGVSLLRNFSRSGNLGSGSNGSSGGFGSGGLGGSSGGFGGMSGGLGGMSGGFGGMSGGMSSGFGGMSGGYGGMSGGLGGMSGGYSGGGSRF